MDTTNRRMLGARVSFAIDVTDTHERKVEAVNKRTEDEPKSNFGSDKELDDLCDPTTNGDEVEGEGESWEEHKRARAAKTQRALLRVSDRVDTLKGIEQDDRQNQRKSYFLGEEEIDKSVSLLHDHDVFHETGSCPIEPFNLKSEREDGDGYFDGDTYIFRRKRNQDEEEDAWLQQMQDESSNTVKHIPMNNNSRVKTKQQQGSTLDRLRREQDDKKSREEIFHEIAMFMANNDETVIQAITRVGSIIKNERKRKRMPGDFKSQDTLIHTDALTQPSTLSSAQVALNRLTELTNTCMMKFDDGGRIFELTREKLLPAGVETNLSQGAIQSRYFDMDPANQSLENSNVPRDPLPVDLKGVQWEYRGNEDNNVHGPFSTQQMLAWIHAGYFLGDSTVDVRIVHVADATKTGLNSGRNTAAVMDDLLDDLNEFDAIEQPSRENEWKRSDQVNFQQYL